MPRTSKAENTKHAMRLSPFGGHHLHLYVNRDLGRAFDDAALEYPSIGKNDFPKPWEGLSVMSDDGHFIFVSKLKMDATLVHELQHLNFNILDYHSIPHTDNTEEVYSVHLEMLYTFYEEMLRELRN